MKSILFPNSCTFNCFFLPSTPHSSCTWCGFSRKISSFFCCCKNSPLKGRQHVWEANPHVPSRGCGFCLVLQVKAKQTGSAGLCALHRPGFLAGSSLSYLIFGSSRLLVPHPHLLPLATTRLLWKSGSLFLFCYTHSFVLFLDSTYSNVFLWLISLSIMLSRSTHVVANLKFSFFSCGWVTVHCVCVCVCVCMHHVFFIHLSVDTWVASISWSL